MNSIKKMLMSTVCLSMFLVSVKALSADIAGTIEILQINRVSGIAYIQMSEAPSTSCSTNYWHYIFPMTTEVDRSMYATLLAAKVAGRQVKIFGSGNCEPTYETIASVRILN